MNKIYVVGGGIAGIALAYAAKFAYNKFFGYSNTISKQVIVNKLIEMREILYPMLFEIADIVQKRLIPKGVPPDQAKIFIMENQTLAFKSNIQAILQQKIYFDIDETQLKYAIEEIYQNDKEVQYYKRAFQQEYEKCFLGIKPENLTTRILLITKDQLLTIVASLLNSKISRLKQIVANCQIKILQSNASISNENIKKAMRQELTAILNKDEKQDDQLRMKLLQNSKIKDLKTFQFAIAKFIQESAQFKQKYTSLQDHFKNSVQEVFHSLQ